MTNEYMNGTIFNVKKTLFSVKLWIHIIPSDGHEDFQHKIPQIASSA